ncbi:MAG: mitofilin family membrane protein [Alphaproteobacteria bacterium]
MRVDPKDRPADAPAGEPKTVIVRRTSWGAVLLSLIAIAIAVGTLLLPVIKPRLLARFGDIPAVAFILGPKDNRDQAFATVRTDLAALEGRVAAAEQKTAAATGRLDAVETQVKDQLSAAIPPLPANATPEQVQDWSATLVQRFEAAETAAREAQSRLETAEAKLAEIDGKVSSVDELRAMTERLGSVETTATQAGDALTAAKADVAGLMQELSTAKAETAKLTESAGGMQSSLTQLEAGLEGSKTETAALKTNLEEVKQAAAAAQATADQVKTAMDALTARATALEARADQIAQTAEANGTKLSAIEESTQSRNSALDTARMTQAIFHLSDALETHKPFAREVAFLRSVAAGDERIAPLVEPVVVYADTGVATNAELRDSFSAIVAPKLLSISDDSRPWLDQLRSWLSSAISPEPAPQPLTGVDPARQIVNGAIRALAEDDLLTAVELLSRLQGPAEVLAQRWLAEAHARMTLDQTREKLATLAMEMLQPAKP